MIILLKTIRFVTVMLKGGNIIDKSNSKKRYKRGTFIRCITTLSVIGK